MANSLKFRHSHSLINDWNFIDRLQYNIAGHYKNPSIEDLFS